MELEVELLAGHLGRDHPVGGVGDLVLREVPRPFGHRARRARALRSATPSPVVAEIMKIVLERRPLVELRGEGQQRPPSSTRSTLLRTRILGSRPVLRGRSSMRARRRASRPAAASTTRAIRSASCGAAPGGGDHRPVEPALGREDAGRVDQQDLRLAGDRDAHQPGARGLRLGGDDRDLLPDQRIDQGRLAGIGRADHRDEAAALGHRNLLQQRLRGLGLGLLLGEALGRRLADALDRHLDDEGRRMVRAGAADQLVDGRLARRCAAAHSCSADLGCWGALSRRSTRVGPGARG